MSIIEIRPFRNRWKVFESARVLPVSVDQEQAYRLRKGPACFALVKIRILD